MLSEANLAMRAIQNEVETLRAAPFTALENVENGPFRSGSAGADRLVNAQRQVTIRDYGDGSLGLKEVTVYLAWTGEHGRTIRKSVTTLIGDKGR